MKNIPFGKPIITEEEKQAVLDVLNNPILVHGPKIKEFEKQFANFTGAKYAISVSSCTAAMHLAYFYLGLEHGDEVIVSAQTHTATAHAVEFCGAKPVFVDSETLTGNIDINLIEDHITEKTRAIAIVHFLGMPVDMERINKIAKKKHNLFVLEDCALAVGTYLNDVHAGLHGDIGCFSFYPIKHMTTAEGGMLITNNDEMAQKLHKQKAFGVDRSQASIAGTYDVNMLGYNYRMNEIQATLGIGQLKNVNNFLKKRKKNYQALQKALSQIDEINLFQSSYDKYISSYYCLSLLLDKSIVAKREEFARYLKQNNIGTSVYYPKPVPHMSYYLNKYKYSKESFPIASQISYSSIALPVGPHINIDDINYMVQIIKQAIMEIKQ